MNSFTENDNDVKKDIICNDIDNYLGHDAMMVYSVAENMGGSIFVSKNGKLINSEKVIKYLCGKDKERRAYKALCGLVGKGYVDELPKNGSKQIEYKLKDIDYLFTRRVKVVNKIKEELGQEALDVYLDLAKKGEISRLFPNSNKERTILNKLDYAGYIHICRYAEYEGYDKFEKETPLAWLETGYYKEYNNFIEQDTEILPNIENELGKEAVDVYTYMMGAMEIYDNDFYGLDIDILKRLERAGYITIKKYYSYEHKPKENIHILCPRIDSKVFYNFIVNLGLEYWMIYHRSHESFGKLKLEGTKWGEEYQIKTDFKAYMEKVRA